MKHEPIATPSSTDADATPAEHYQPVTLHRQRHDGWTADRQRTFLTALAETGCISEACRLTGITARSAYRLRAHPLGRRFAAAWDQALRYATARLMTLAYERAIKGAVRETWRDGKLVSETRAPSDQVLIFLLAKLVPQPANVRSHWGDLMGASGHAAAQLAPVFDALTDCDVPVDELSEADFVADPPLPSDRRARPFDEDLGEDDDA